MYANDTAICVSVSDKAGVTKLMQDDLINVNDWLCANRLSLHIGKTYDHACLSHRHNAGDACPMIIWIYH